MVSCTRYLFRTEALGFQNLFDIKFELLSDVTK